MVLPETHEKQATLSHQPSASRRSHPILLTPRRLPSQPVRRKHRPLARLQAAVQRKTLALLAPLFPQRLLACGQLSQQPLHIAPQPAAGACKK